jgi:hypothetical protein
MLLLVDRHVLTLPCATFTAPTGTALLAVLALKKRMWVLGMLLQQSSTTRCTSSTGLTYILKISRTWNSSTPRLQRWTRHGGKFMITAHTMSPLMNVKLDQVVLHARCIANYKKAHWDVILRVGAHRRVWGVGCIVQWQNVKISVHVTISSCDELGISWEPDGVLQGSGRPRWIIYMGRMSYRQSLRSSWGILWQMGQERSTEDKFSVGRYIIKGLVPLQWFK